VPRLLVTGMSGTGKSTVLAELARRGHRVVDTDYGGWCEDVVPPGSDATERLWREDRMHALLADDAPDTLVVSGCTANQGRFYDRFDAVVLLTLPEEELLRRIASRTSNDYGKAPGERERILRDLHTVEPLLRATATCVLDATRPLHETADAIEAVSRSLGKTP
jgi:dephospho-CoA kinase